MPGQARRRRRGGRRSAPPGRARAPRRPAPGRRSRSGAATSAVVREVEAVGAAREAQIGRRDGEIGAAAGQRPLGGRGAHVRECRRDGRADPLPYDPCPWPLAAAEHPGLTSEEVARARAALGERAPERSSRSLASIVRENVFTLVNGIALGFLVLIVVAGAWADAIFAVIIVVNTLHRHHAGGAGQAQARQARAARGPARPRAPRRRSQEVTPEDARARRRRRGRRRRPGARGRRGAARRARLALDESILTGESDHIGKQPGDEVLSGAFVRRGQRACTR